MSANDDIETIRDALREFAYRPGQPVFSRYEAATAALARIEKKLDAFLAVAPSQDSEQ